MSFRVSIIKKNQLVILVIALMLITAGYLNYTYSEDNAIATATNNSDENFGDARLVSSNNLMEESVILDTTDTMGSGENENIITEATSSTNTSSGNEYFVSTRLEREKMYSQQLETNNNILNSSNASDEDKKKASEEIAKINNIKNQIMIAENLIKLKDFEDIVILVNGNNINVVIKAQELDTDKVAQIQNIVSRELNSQIENIHITKKS